MDNSKLMTKDSLIKMDISDIFDSMDIAKLTNDIKKATTTTDALTLHVALVEKAQDFNAEMNQRLKRPPLYFVI